MLIELSSAATRRRSKSAHVAAEPEVLGVLQACRRRIRSWRVPPNWSSMDWLKEIEAIQAVAAWQADYAYDPSSRIKREAFIYQQVMARALTRYRQEWRYALRFISSVECGSYLFSSKTASDPASSDGDDDPLGNTCSNACIIFDDLNDALTALPEAQQQLIKNLFWHGHTESEVGAALGISQRAVSKRKHLILKVLRERLSSKSHR